MRADYEIPHPLCHAKQESPGPRRRVQNGYVGIAKTLGAEMVPQHAVERANHVPHNFKRSVEDTVPLTRCGIEDLEKILVEVQDGVTAICLDGKDRVAARLRCIGLACWAAAREQVVPIEPQGAVFRFWAEVFDVRAAVIRRNPLSAVDANMPLLGK